MQTGLNKPLYVQIQEYIAEMILSGKLQPETRLQSEREFSEELGVSRMTVRRALTELVAEGLLERRHGSGTYVAKPRVTYLAHELVDSTGAMRSRNIATNSQLLEFSEIVASRRLAELLDLEIGNSIYRVIILRHANRVPVLLERGFYPASRCPQLEEWDLEKSEIPGLLAQIYGARLGKVIQTLEAVAANEGISAPLRVREGFPLLMLSRTVYDAESGKPIQYAQDFYRGDYARIQMSFNMGAGTEPGKEGNNFEF
jgi:GntR family transcriptional regulator